MNSDGSRCGEKTMSGTAELSVKSTPRGNGATPSGAPRANKRGEFSTRPPGDRLRVRSQWRRWLLRMARVSPGRYHARSFLQRPNGNPMSSYTTNEIRGGMKLLIDGDPYAVIENEYVKPGKGQAFNRIRVRNLRTGRTVEKSYRSGESIEAADVMDSEMQYLYKDGDFWTFMNPENYEQLHAGEAAVGEAAQVAQGRHRLHHHAVERRAAAGDAAAAHRAQGRSRPIRACAATPPPAARSPPSSRPAPWCACRCSSTKVKCCASTRAPASTSRAARRLASRS